jgi:hypothetical protein
VGGTRPTRVGRIRRRTVGMTGRVVGVTVRVLCGCRRLGEERVQQRQVGRAFVVQPTGRRQPAHQRAREQHRADDDLDQQ